MTMTEEYGTLVCTEDYEPYTIHCEWKGPLIGHISRFYVTMYANWVSNDVFQIGPHKFTVVETDPNVYTVAYHSKWSWVRIIWHKGTRALKLFNYRFLKTLTIWGLADYSPYHGPTWNDVYLVQWLNRKLNK